MKITKALAWLAFDSRGEATVAIKLWAGQKSALATAPAGASTGGREIPVIRDGISRVYEDTLTTNVIDKFNTSMAKQIIGLDPSDVDTVIEEIDGSAANTKYGTHIMTATSVAASILAAKIQDCEIFEYFASQTGESPALPMPMVNIISGAAHANGTIDIQDILCIPNGAKSFSQSIHMANQVRRKSKELMLKEGYAASLVADEGGLAANFKSNKDAINLVSKAILECGFEPLKEVSLAIDFAANQLLNESNKYYLNCEGIEIDGIEFAHLISSWVDEFPIISIEDPLSEDDEAGWKEISGLLKSQIQIIGDDRFATDADLVEAAIKRGDANSVLIKPNQTGTLNRARKTLSRAKESGWSTVISARSGDTEESWLADLATGWNSGQIKVGSTMRSERTAKWNRLLEIEATTNIKFSNTEFLGRSFES